MFDTFFYNPIYNLVVLLSDYIVDAGVVIIIATLIIKIILFPLYRRQIDNQIATKKAKPHLEALNKKYKGRVLTPEENQQKMQETLALYREHQIKPFSSLFILLIQLPILIALY